MIAKKDGQERIALKTWMSAKMDLFLAMNLSIKSALTPRDRLNANVVMEEVISPTVLVTGLYIEIL